MPQTSSASAPPAADETDRVLAALCRRILAGETEGRALVLTGLYCFCAYLVLSAFGLHVFAAISGLLPVRVPPVLSMALGSLIVMSPAMAIYVVHRRQVRAILAMSDAEVRARILDGSGSRRPGGLAPSRAGLR